MTEINSNQEQPKMEQIIDWEDRYKRLAAEIENTKKRLAKNSSQTFEQMLDRLLLEMIPFADNLERILNNQLGDVRCSQLVDGVRLPLRDFQNTLKRYGVKPLEALNRPFDPAFHEATAVIEHPSQPGGTVIEVIQTGYLREDRLLRPAQVIVSTD